MTNELRKAITNNQDWKKRHNVAIEGKFYWAKKQTNNNNSANKKKYERKPTEKTQGNKKRLF